MNRVIHAWLVVLSLLLLMPRVGHAQQCEQATPEKWHNAFTVYLWLPAESGTIAARGRTATVDTTIGDAWDALSNLRGAFAGHYEGGQGTWSVFADLFYVNLEGTATVDQTTINFSPNETIAEIGGGYKVGQKSLDSTVVGVAEAIAGLRITSLGMDLNGTTPDGEINVSGSQTWVDPFVGLRYKQVLSPTWTIAFRGDIGGFGIGNSSHFVWNALVDLRYTWVTNWSIDFGWRWLDYTHDNGTGNDFFEYNVLMQGPYSGITYKW